MTGGGGGWRRSLGQQKSEHMSDVALTYRSGIETYPLGQPTPQAWSCARRAEAGEGVDGGAGADAAAARAVG